MAHDALQLEKQLAAFQRYPPGADGRLCEAGPGLLTEPLEELIEPKIVHAARDGEETLSRTRAFSLLQSAARFASTSFRSSCPR